LKSAVKKADRYEPVINDSYQALAEHYGTVIIPARPRKPKDKPKAENGVLIVERWLLARIRNETFHTLRALNARLKAMGYTGGRSMLRYYIQPKRKMRP
ncbi:IS21 family transposase, partial [Escherichia coli]|nr:IS21 family transposase [Escherichia coli]